MKYYNIDLTQFVPYGIPLNSTYKVESKNHINEFFLRGFEKWYNQLFTVDDIGTLVRDYSRSCTAPYSLTACKYCTNDQLEKFIQCEGFIYYSANDHNVNAKFVYDLFRYTYGTQEYLSSIAQYVSNNPDVDAEILYDGYDTYEYGIRLYGDILGAVNVHIMIDRITEYLKILGTAHTTLQAVEFEDTSSEINTYATCIGDNSCIYYDSYLKEIAPEPPEKPDLDVFNPEIPFYIENIGDVPVEVGLYNHSTGMQVRTNCKISYDNSTWQNYSLALTINQKDGLIGKITLANKGDRVYIKADLTNTPSNSSHYTNLTVLNESANTKIRARGNIASINKGTNDVYKTDYLAISQGYCYARMFKDCTSLTQAPDLPSIALSRACYYGMFQGCTSLKQAPELPATKLILTCYQDMFNGCTSLNYVKIHATDISASYCLYQWLKDVAPTGDFYCKVGVSYPTGAHGMEGIPNGWTRHDV